MAKAYIPRIADEILTERLAARGAILVEGPKWCGKSTTAGHVAKSAVYMQDPSTREQNAMLARVDSARFLRGETPRLIDEWQVIPFIWDAIRFEVDQRGEFGQFVLTGSVTPPDTSEITHSGTGRIGRMRMRTMTLAETRDSSREVSLEGLFNSSGSSVEGVSPLSLEELAFVLCRGGWPTSVGRSQRVALRQATDYYEDLVSTDFTKVDGVRRDDTRVARFLRSYARNTAAAAPYTTIRDDMKANDGVSINEDTVASYAAVMRKLFVIEDVKAWQPNLRSKTAIRTSDTRHFVDPSIAAAALSAGPDDLMDDLRTFGLLFESLCVRDLRVYAQRLGGEVLHYRDKAGREADIVVHLRDGRYGLIEVKLASQERIDEGAENLLAIKADIDRDKMDDPSFLAVVTATPYAYRRPDGVAVIPLATLAP